MPKWATGVNKRKLIELDADRPDCQAARVIKYIAIYYIVVISLKQFPRKEGHKRGFGFNGK